MFCHKCGARIPEDSAFCPKCGSPVQMLSQQTPVDDPAVAHAATKSPRGKRNAVSGAISVAAAIVAIVAVAVFIDPYHQSANDSLHTSESDSSGTSTQSDDNTGDSSTTGDNSVINSILNECPSVDETTSLTSSSGLNPSSIDGQSYALLSFHNDNNNASAVLGPVLTCVARETGTTSNEGGAINDTSKLYMDLFNISMDNLNASNLNDMPAYSIGDGSVSARCSLNMQSMWTVCALTGSGSDDSSSSDGQSDNSSSNVDHGTPDDAVGYDKYKDYNCPAGNSGKLIPCSEIYEDMGKNMNYLPFGRENNPDSSDSFGFIPVDENRNGVIDEDEGYEI